MKPFYKHSEDLAEQPQNMPQAATATPAAAAEYATLLPVKRGRGRPRKHPLPADITVFMQHNDFRRSEITDLLEKGVFEVIDAASIQIRRSSGE